MILRTFPDIGWLQQQANSDFADTWKTENGQESRRGWPTVILHTVATTTERPNIKGPLSIFTTIGGRSTVAVEQQRAVVGEQTYFISNQGQRYTNMK